VEPKPLRSRLVNLCGCGCCRVCDCFRRAENRRRAQLRYDQGPKRRYYPAIQRRYKLRRKGARIG